MSSFRSLSHSFPSSFLNFINCSSSPCGVHLGEPESSVQSVQPAAIRLPGAPGASHFTCVPSKAGEGWSVTAGGELGVSKRRQTGPTCGEA